MKARIDRLALLLKNTPRKKLLAMAGLLLVVLALPLIVITSQQQTNTKQHASGGVASIPNCTQRPTSTAGRRQTEKATWTTQTSTTSCGSRAIAQTGADGCIVQSGQSETAATCTKPPGSTADIPYTCTCTIAAYCSATWSCPALPGVLYSDCGTFGAATQCPHAAGGTSAPAGTATPKPAATSAAASTSCSLHTSNGDVSIPNGGSYCASHSYVDTNACYSGAGRITCNSGSFSTPATCGGCKYLDKDHATCITSCTGSTPVATARPTPTPTARPGSTATPTPRPSGSTGGVTTPPIGLSAVAGCSPTQQSTLEFHWVSMGAARYQVKWRANVSGAAFGTPQYTTGTTFKFPSSAAQSGFSPNTDIQWAVASCATTSDTTCGTPATGHLKTIACTPGASGSPTPTPSGTPGPSAAPVASGHYGISGKVFYDRNYNGTMDSGEGASGVNMIVTEQICPPPAQPCGTRIATTVKSDGSGNLNYTGASIGSSTTGAPLCYTIQPGPPPSGAVSGSKYSFSTATSNPVGCATPTAGRPTLSPLVGLISAPSTLPVGNGQNTLKLTVKYNGNVVPNWAFDLYSDRSPAGHNQFLTDANGQVTVTGIPDAPIILRQSNPSGSTLGTGFTSMTIDGTPATELTIFTQYNFVFGDSSPTNPGNVTYYDSSGNKATFWNGKPGQLGTDQRLYVDTSVSRTLNLDFNLNPSINPPAYFCDPTNGGINQSAGCGQPDQYALFNYPGGGSIAQPFWGNQPWTYIASQPGGEPKGTTQAWSTSDPQPGIVGWSCLSNQCVQTTPGAYTNVTDCRAACGSGTTPPGTTPPGGSCNDVQKAICTVQGKTCDPSTGQCVGGGTPPPTGCTDGSFQCSGNNVQVCVNNSFVQLRACTATQTCNQGTGTCDGGTGGGGCNTGDYQCAGQVLQVCKNKGWTDSKTCSATQTCNSSIPACVDNGGGNGTTKINLDLGLDGIGSAGDHQNPNGGGNQNPLTTGRDVTVQIYDTSHNLVDTQTGTVNYVPSTGRFTGSVNLKQGFTSGLYKIYVKSPRYLRRTSPGDIQISSGATVSFAATLVAGDIVDDNAITILDYNAFMSCSIFSKDNKAACNQNPSYKVNSDLNNNGIIDQDDYNLLLREWVVQNGD